MANTVTIPGNPTNSVGGSITFPTDLATQGPQISFQFFKYHKPSPFAKTTFNLTDAIIYLPIPANLVDNYNLQYQDYAPGFWALLESGNPRAIELAVDIMGIAGVADLAASGHPVLAAITGALGATGLASSNNLINATNAFNSLKAGGLPDSKALGPSGRFVLEDIGSRIDENLGSTFENYFHTAPNPNTTVAFKAPALRVHSFSWMMAAKNSTETNIIKQIIQTFKNNFLPQVTADRFFLNYPNLIYPQFLGTGDYLYTFKMCVITDFSVNYAPAGPSFFSNGLLGGYPPTLVTISLVLKEIMLFTQGDVDLTQAQLFAQDVNEGAAPLANPDDLNAIIGG